MKLYLDYPKHRINSKHLEHDRNSIKCNFLNASKLKQNITNSECFEYSKCLQSTDSNMLMIIICVYKTTFLTHRIRDIKCVSKISTKTYYQLETFTAYYTAYYTAIDMYALTRPYTVLLVTNCHIAIFNISKSNIAS